MINEQKFSDASERDFGRQAEEIFSPGILAFLGGGLLGAILGGAAVFVARAFFASDEPPIRVKGGSMQLDVLSTAVTWQPIGTDGKKWKLTHGDRGKDDYDVTVVTTSMSCASTSVTGKDVRVEYTDTDANVVRWVELKSTGKKTQVKNASDALKLSTDERQLYFAGAGYISKIKVDAHEFNFASKAELEHALLMDF